MKINGSTKIHDLIEKYPFLADFLPEYNPKFSMLKNKLMRATVGKVATLQMVATMGETQLSVLLPDLQKAIREKTGETIETDEDSGNLENDKIEALKQIMQGLHDNEDMESAREQFNLLLQDVRPEEIKNMEEQMIRQGTPVAEIQKLCDLHVGVFKNALDGQAGVSSPAGHPVHTYQAENKKLQEHINAFDCLLKALGEPGDRNKFKEVKTDLLDNFELLALVETHYVRKENQIFPYMEKHGITAPPQVMWGVHNEIRNQLKAVRTVLENVDLAELVKQGTALNLALTEMIYKEEKILFPMILEAFTEQEWGDIRRGEDELGYVFVEPGKDWQPAARQGAGPVTGVEPGLTLNTGSLTLHQVDLMLRHLPMDISFVDENDEVRYYSETPERLFPRSPGVIGRQVQKCHPPQSMHVVENILKEFKSGRKDSAEFWIEMRGKKLHIRYFAVRDAQGGYRGTLEVTQDITAIQKLEGQKRLLDWIQA